MLSYYHKKINISLRKFDQTIFEGAIAHFDLKIFHQKFVQYLHIFTTV